MKKKVLLWGRFVLIALLIILQFGWLVMVFYKFSYQFTYANYIIRMLAVILVLHIVNRTMNPNHKLLWTFLILLVSVFGILCYFVFGRKDSAKSNHAKLNKIRKEMQKYMHQTPELNQAIEQQDKAVYRQMNISIRWSGMAIGKMRR